MSALLEVERLSAGYGDVPVLHDVSLHVDEGEVERAILEAAGPGPVRRMVDLGSGAGRMLTLLSPRAESAVGLDLSQQMLNIARTEAAWSSASQAATPAPQSPPWAR